MLFRSGYLPGALLAIVLMIGSYIISVKENYPKGSPFTIRGFIKQLGTSIWALAAVVIVVFGVVGGVFTATESAAIAVIYSLLVSVFVYKGLDWKGVWHALDECVNTLSIVLILIATSAVFGNCLYPGSARIPARALRPARRAGRTAAVSNLSAGADPEKAYEMQCSGTPDTSITPESPRLCRRGLSVYSVIRRRMSRSAYQWMNTGPSGLVMGLT